jgi:hypothetical protein
VRVLNGQLEAFKTDMPILSSKCQSMITATLALKESLRCSAQAYVDLGVTAASWSFQEGDLMTNFKSGFEDEMMRELAGFDQGEENYDVNNYTHTYTHCSLCLSISLPPPPPPPPCPLLLLLLLLQFFFNAFFMHFIKHFLLLTMIILYYLGIQNFINCSSSFQLW